MGLKDLLRDEIRSNALAVTVSVVMATMTGASAAVLAKLEGLSGSEILTVGLLSLAAALAIIASALYIKSHVSAGRVRAIGIAVGLLFLYGGFRLIGNALDEIDRLRQADRDLQKVDREDPAHATFDQRLIGVQNELNKERIERLAAQQRNADLELEVQALQRRLTRDEQREVLIGALAKIAAQLTNWRNQCRQYDPAVYADVAQALVERGVKLLTDAGLANEARRLADGKTPPSGQFQPRDCSPNDANAQASYGIQGRLFVLDEVITELRR